MLTCRSVSAQQGIKNQVQMREMIVAIAEIGSKLTDLEKNYRKAFVVN
jgi:hypothetical protein